MLLMKFVKISCTRGTATEVVRAIDLSNIHWDKFCQATMVYYMNPATLSHRRSARSKDEVYYVDRATVLI